MKKLREMKKNNKGFSLVELIVVIAIMVVLVAVLGSTILGYIDESRYSKDIQALDSIDTAMSLLIADPDSDYSSANGATVTLHSLMVIDGNEKLEETLAEVFDIPSGGEAAEAAEASAFRNSSSAFEGVTTNSVLVQINNGAVTITVPSADTDFDAYQSPEGSTALTAPATPS